MKYKKVLNRHIKKTAKDVEKDKLKKILTYNKVVKNIKRLSWDIKVSAKDVNKLYSMKNNCFKEECEKLELEIQYPLDFRPKELIELQNELDKLGDEISKIAEKYSTILNKSLK
ncbi:hypothetical protein CRV02_01035 [Arcobacter sp. CECT 8989]|uniref:hypothetical protein n=1 Tax=Arcobacter sp. CECT 8989 TaxID=2044509 RepID=UPI00100BA7A2|nr:hypothetical protein [Arcobacter sp. CECT 8989]RXK03810.1 hypothetical protein CRV02_01035 [Arcobacter sp. CECT 8989]